VRALADTASPPKLMHGGYNISTVQKSSSPVDSSQDENSNVERSKSNSSSKFVHNHGKPKPSPPFRPYGRGAMQLTRALALSQDSSPQSPSMEFGKWVLCTGNPPCFAKVLTVPSNSDESVCIQPMKPSELDPNLLVLWDGHTWLAKRGKLIPVRVRYHLYKHII
jgi:hypothetical protein